MVDLYLTDEIAEDGGGIGILHAGGGEGFWTLVMSQRAQAATGFILICAVNSVATSTTQCSAELLHDGYVNPIGGYG